ncbi:MAG: lyase family protein, partial [Candidatus Eisenbacteria bacterium]|nr:lyase family protein [Candidatus Eisenbacteria bacterium]
MDVFQTGSGTSTNMNANEVIARRASQLLGACPPDIHPNDHVNMGQSSNDVIPSAIHVAALVAIERDLLPRLDMLVATLSRKAAEFDQVVKIGRTHLQDATPIRLGQEFHAWAQQTAAEAGNVRRAGRSLSELAMGGTAVGTGTNTHPEFGARMAAELTTLTGFAFREASHHVAAQSYPQAIVAASAALHSLAAVLLKMA